MLETEHTQEVKNFYFLRTEDFSLTAERVNTVPYRSGDKVARGNFYGLIKNSFVKNPNNPSGQYRFFVKLKLEGFDYKTTFQNFRAAGGWDCLTQKEKDDFLDVFSRIPVHSTRFLKENFLEIIKTEIDNLINFLADMMPASEQLIVESI